MEAHKENSRRKTEASQQVEIFDFAQQVIDNVVLTETR